MATIDTNMSLVMIDPNEPLELYDGTIIKGRLEWFLYALCCLDYGNLPTPLSRIEEWANALITNELPNMEPQSRAEEFFKAILTGDTSNLPTPQSRSEVLLDKLARGENDFTNVEKIQSRYEFLLAYLIKNGGGIGNIDYVLYKFQKEDETLYNTKERPVKSAILKGQTLVNLNTNKSRSKVLTPEINNDRFYNFNIPYVIQSNTDFTIKGKCDNQSTSNVVLEITYSDNTYSYLELLETGKSGIFDKSYNRTKDIKSLRIYLQNNTTGNATISDVVCVIGNMINKNIPYFEGMQSVKMPVLTTTGKNFKQGSPIGSFNENNGEYVFTNMSNRNGIRFDVDNTMKIGDTITVSVDCKKSEDFGNNLILLAMNNDVELIKKSVPFSTTYERKSLTITIPNNTTHLFLGIGTSLYRKVSFSNIQIEKGSTATTYEPFKSNILSTPSDLELRRINDVKDELNCLTGEVAERIGEIVLDGSDDEVWITAVGGSNTHQRFVLKRGNRIKPISNVNENKFLCDKFKTVKNITGENSQEMCLMEGYDDWYVSIIIDNTKLNSVDVDGFRLWLQSNPVKFNYVIETESIKTVDLSIVDQGGATIPKLKTFDKITHVNVSATDILPGEVEMEVATTIGEDLSGTLYSSMEDIETKQEALKESNNAQTESVNSTMMATTEIYESLL